ncbi:hypothetical protein AGMMS49521_0490 [Campylobacterota bacterium]|nr:hypothetical protein AGMMS49521_0490 [Campylobacterota bacterium]
MEAMKQEYTITVTEGNNQPAQEYAVTIERKPVKTDADESIDDYRATKWVNDYKTIMWFNVLHIFAISIMLMSAPEAKWYLYPLAVLVAVIFSLFLMPLVIPELIVFKIVVWFIKLFRKPAISQPSAS